MLPFRSTKKTEEGITILGVSHITANLDAVLNELQKIEINQNTVVFVEPKKNIITGKENCNKAHIANFFAQVLKYIMIRRATFIPLNATYMPSHNSAVIIHKYANQLAEEEYMADIIDKTEIKGKKLVIIGDIHAERLKRLLVEKDHKVEYIKISPVTPDDIVIRSFRDAIEGRKSDFISLNWLKVINDEIRQNLNIQKSNTMTVQEAVWDSEDRYRRYQHEAKRLMRKHKMRRYRVRVDDETRELSRNIYNVTKKTLEHFRREDDHPVLAFPYSQLA